MNSYINVENNKNTFIIYDDKEDIISENEWNDIFIQHKTYSDLSKNQIYKINNSLEKGISSNLRPKIWKFLSKSWKKFLWKLFKNKKWKNRYWNKKRYR